MRFDFRHNLAERERTIPNHAENAKAPVELASGGAAAVAVLEEEEFNPDELYLDLGVGD